MFYYSILIHGDESNVLIKVLYRLIPVCFVSFYLLLFSRDVWFCQLLREHVCKC
jgi:hypothetical protein